MASGKCRPQSTPLSILSIGRDPEILRLREQVIRNGSEMVVRSMGPEEAESWTRRSEPHLWLFCNTIELSRAVYLACSIRRYSPCSRLVLLEGASCVGFEGHLFHRVLSSAEGIGALVEAVSYLASAA